MKRLLHISALLALAVITASCNLFPHEEVEKRMVLLYIAATEQSFSPYAEGNISEMLYTYVPEKDDKSQVLLVFFQNRNTASSTQRSEATLSRYYKNRAGNVMQELIATYDENFNACDPDSFAKVLATAEAKYSPTYRSLLFSSHGTGWLPEGYFENNADRTGWSTVSANADDGSMPLAGRDQACYTIGYDARTRDELEIDVFADILGKYHWEAALLDCCYMGTIEVAYQLRNCCDWVIASPTEILITGFPYPYILDNLFNAPGELGLTNICEQYYNMYQSQSGTYQSGTIVLVKCSELDNLATVCANAVSESRDAMAEVRRMGVQHYFYNDTNDYFFDFAHYYEQFTSASRFAEFSAQLDKAVPYKASTQRFLNLKIEHYCGLSCYIPKDAYPILNAHYKQLAWNQKVKVIE